MIGSRERLVGVRKAERSVLSGAVAPAISGASRWLEARTDPTDVAAISAAPARATAFERLDTTRFSSARAGAKIRVPSGSDGTAADASRLLAALLSSVVRGTDGFG